MRRKDWIDVKPCRSRTIAGVAVCQGSWGTPLSARSIAMKEELEDLLEMSTMSRQKCEGGVGAPVGGVIIGRYF